MVDKTEIREPNFGIDLPGTWEQTESTEDIALAFKQVEGPAMLTVVLLGVRPMFAIADQRRVLEDYVSHRSRFEEGHAPALAYLEPVVEEFDGRIEARWMGEDPMLRRVVRHRAILTGGLLADFAYEASGAEPREFAAEADEVLASATATA